VRAAAGAALDGIDSKMNRCVAMPDLKIIDQDGDVVLAELVLDDGTTIEVVASIKLVESNALLV